MLPRHQTEYPARPLLAETTLHGRREMTFLVLTALYFVVTTAFVVLGATRVIDVSALIVRFVPDAPRPIALLVPLGVVPFALSLIASSLLCELLGGRRAGALVLFGAVTNAALVGLMRCADLIDGGNAFTVAVAFAIASLVANSCNLVIFNLLRRLSPGQHLLSRMIVAAWLSLAASYFATEGIAPDVIALGSAIIAGAVVLVLAIPTALVARGLAIALRVGPSWFSNEEAAPGEPAWTPRRTFAEGSVARPLPQAHVVETPPYNSAEMRFFADGDCD